MNVYNSTVWVCDSIKIAVQLHLLHLICYTSLCNKNNSLQFVYGRNILNDKLSLELQIIATQKTFVWTTKEFTKSQPVFWGYFVMASFALAQVIIHFTKNGVVSFYYCTKLLSKLNLIGYESIRHTIEKRSCVNQSNLIIECMLTLYMHKCQKRMHICMYVCNMVQG